MENPLYTSFKLDCPMIYNKAENIIQDGPYDLVIFHKDGSVYTYSTIDRYLIRVSKTHTPTDKEYAKAFGRKLYLIAYHKGLNQNELAKTLGVSQGTVSNYMTGRVVPSLCQIRKLAMMFNMPISDLLLKF